MKTNRRKTSIIAVFSLLMLSMLSLSGTTSLFARQNAQSGANRPLAAGDWPMYGHDISRTNYNPDETTLNTGNISQLVSRWQMPIGTNGTASSSGPSVANGKVYVGSSVASGNNFFVFDATTGSTAWAVNLGYQSTCFNVGIGATAAISGSVVVAGGGDSPNAAYYGLNDAANGAQLWRNAMGVGSSGFPWESPLIGPNGRAYLGMASRCDNPSIRGEVRSVNYLDGSAPVSQYFVPSGTAGGGIWNSPALSPDGNTLVVVTGEDYSCSPNCQLTRSMVTLDANTLAVLQSNQQGTSGQDQDWGTTPLVFHDSQNRTLIEGHLKSFGVYAYDITNVNAGPIWNRSIGTSVGMMDAYDPSYGSGGTLFLYGSGGSLYAVDPATGVNRWGPVSTASGAHGNMAVANGMIFMNLGSTGLRVFDETNGSTIRTIVPANPGATNSGVAVSNGFVYWVSGGNLNAWSLPAVVGTATPTGTSIPATSTATTVPTSTVAPSATRTVTPVLPSSTPTIVPPTSTTQPSATSTRTATSVPSVTVPVPTNTVVQASATRTATAITPPSATQTATGIVPTSTAHATGTATSTTVPASTSTPGGATETATTTVAPSETPTSCAISFTDVPPDSTFYAFIRCLACRGIISGYSDGTFRPNNEITRGQIAKMVSNAAGFSEDPGPQVFEDVDSTNPFYIWINRLSNRGFMGGYPCGTIPQEPCISPDNRPYFRPFANTTRGQLAKIVANAAGVTGEPTGLYYTDVPQDNPFYLWIMRLTERGVMSGYPCGGPNEPCDDQQRPYFRPFANVTRGQASKIVANTFLPDCQTPQR